MIILKKFSNKNYESKIRAVYFYDLFSPSINLKDIIASYRHIYSKPHIILPISFIRVPDGAFDISINLNENDKAKAVTLLGITDKFQANIFSENINLLSIKIAIGHIFQLTQIPACEFYDRKISLTEILDSSVLEVLEEIKSSNDTINQFNTIDKYLKSKLKFDEIKMPECIEKIINLLQTKRIFMPSEINEISQISSKQLSRLFDKFIGIKPKPLSRILRIQNSVELMHQKSPANFSNIALKSGFYDQAHFIKEFKKYTGITPSQFNCKL